MPDDKMQRGGSNLTDQAALNLLLALEEEAHVTQRGLSTRIGIALGLTNGLLKRALNKGYVKIREVPTKRYAYYLTPKGFREKSNLVVDYLSSSLAFFRLARQEYQEATAQAKERGCQRIALYGAGELAEIAQLSAQEVGVEFCGVIQPGCNEPTLSRTPVYSSIEKALEDGVDAVLITATDNPQKAYDSLCSLISESQVLTIPLLHISKRTHAEEE